MTISGAQFTLRFAPEETSANEMAGRLCKEQAAVIGVDTDEQLSNCIAQVTSYVQQNVDNWMAEKTLQVPVTVSGTRFDVKYLPELDDARVLAARLCSAEQLSLNEADHAGCVDGVVEYLHRRGRAWVDEKTLRTRLTVQGLPFELAFMPERQSAAQMATRVCSEHAEALGITEANLAECVAAVGATLSDRVSRWVNSKTLSVPVTVNGQTFSVIFFPERESVDAVARRVCLSQAEALQLTDATYGPDCRDPLAQFLNAQIEAWLTDKQVIVRLTMGGEEVAAIVAPDRQTTSSVAQRVCVERAAALGLTRETIGTECIEPVDRLLQAGVQNWQAERARRLLQQTEQQVQQQQQ